MPRQVALVLCPPFRPDFQRLKITLKMTAQIKDDSW